MLTASYWISSLALAAVAVLWAYVLVQPGMLLAPAQARVRAWWRGRYEPRCLVTQEVDEQWWFKPLWGCYLCVAGQAGFWGYLLLDAPAYRAFLGSPRLLTFFAAVLVHLAFTAFTIFFAAGLRAYYSWTQQQP